jgi:hypothetical protein
MLTGSWAHDTADVLAMTRHLTLVVTCPPHYNEVVDLDRLPGGELVGEGLRDLAEGRETVAALLLQVGAPRLGRLGLSIPTHTNAEHRLYTRLASDDPLTAHSRYNALIRRLVSFERAAECVS